MNAQRRIFPESPQHSLLLRVLLAQDGSTTRICEALSGGPVQVQMHKQIRTQAVPDAVRRQLGGNQWLERVTSLCSESGVLMDNLSFTRLDAVPEDFLQDLDRGIAPIGHLLERLYVRRETAEADAEVKARLWDVVGLPDPAASRAYCIVTSHSPLMYIFESFRGDLVGG